MPIGDDTYAYRRRLPHLVNRGKTYFVTFCVQRGLTLSNQARDMTLASCIHDHQVLCWVDCCVVMPDHVHLIFTPLIDYDAMEVCSLAKIIRTAIISNRLLSKPNCQRSVNSVRQT